MSTPSHPSPETVLAELGEDLLRAVLTSVNGARDDYKTLSDFRPNWVKNATQRFSANFLHERMWAHLVPGVAALPDITVTDQEPTREVWSGTKYAIRVKRHDLESSISTYPTAGALEFWTNSDVALSGLEQMTLAVGYQWEPLERVVGNAVLSYRTTKDAPVWTAELLPAVDATSRMRWRLVRTKTADIDLTQEAWEQEPQEVP